MEHHPVFPRFPRWRGPVRKGARVDFLGVLTQDTFEDRMPGARPSEGRDAGEPVPLPAFDEEYLEWIDVLEAVLTARDNFVMFELGAGYGRWLVRAVAALRAVNSMPYRLVVVEPEPTYFDWLHEHLADGSDVAEPPPATAPPRRRRGRGGNTVARLGKPLPLRSG